MADTGPVRFGDGWTGGSYASQWNRFVSWSEASGRSSLPASPEDVATYLAERWQSGAKPATLKVAAAAITRYHREAGFDAPFQSGFSRQLLDELTRYDTSSPSRVMPLDLDCFLAIRKTAQEPRSSRGGRMERASNALRRGAVDIAMIGLMRDARLRVSEAAALVWGDIEDFGDGSGRVRVGDTGHRVISADTMELLSSVRRDASDGDLVLGLRPNQIAARIGAAAKQAGLGEGFSGDSPRMGMIRDLENLGVLLLADYLADKEG